MIDPWLSKPRVGVRIGVKDFVILDDQLPGAQMPPQIGIGGGARRHGKKAQSQDDHEQAARLKELIHQCEDNTARPALRYRIGSPLRAGRGYAIAVRNPLTG